MKADSQCESAEGRNLGGRKVTNFDTVLVDLPYRTNRWFILRGGGGGDSSGEAYGRSYGTGTDTFIGIFHWSFHPIRCLPTYDITYSIPSVHLCPSKHRQIRSFCAHLRD